MKTTGRKFRCIGLEEINISSWSHNFELDGIYDEVEDDSDIEPETEPFNSLYLLEIDKFNRGWTWYVDASQFELIEYRKPIMEMLKEALQFAEDNDLHFTYNVQLKIFYFYKTGLMSDHIKVGDTNKFEIEKLKMKQHAN